MPFVVHKRWYGSPLLAIRSDEVHYKNIQETQKSAMTFIPLTPLHIVPDEVPLPRVNITGNVVPITKQEDIEIIMAKYDEIHPGSVEYIRKENVFSFYEFQPGDVYYMESTRQLSNITAEEFRQAPEDPISPFSRKLLETINTEFLVGLRAICKEYGAVEVDDAFIFGVDKFGFDMLGKETATGNWLAFRMPWPKPITDLANYEITLKQALKDALKK